MRSACLILFITDLSFLRSSGFCNCKEITLINNPLVISILHTHCSPLNQISGKPFETLSYRTQLDKVYFRSMVFEVWNVFQIWTWNFNTLQNTLQRGFKNRAFTNLQPYSRVNVKVEHRPYLFDPDGIKREHASKQFSLNHIKEALFPLFSIRYPNWITLNVMPFLEKENRGKGPEM